MVPAKAKHTPIQRFRLDADLWRRFGEAAHAAGKNRSQVLAEFVRWYVRERGVQPPTRPDQRRAHAAA